MAIQQNPYKIDNIGAADSSASTDINPEDVVAWLITQPNANGTLYLKNVVRQYMGALRTAPAKLDMPASMGTINVFACRTPDALDACWNAFKAATNYNRVNSITSGMFSAALNCYKRYLHHIADNAQAYEAIGTYVHKDDESVQEAQEPCIFQIIAPEPKLDLDCMVVGKLVDVLTEHFSNGFRLNSPIEMMRFRSFATKKLGDELTLSDEALKVYIGACGTAYEDKIYAVSNATKTRLRILAEDYFTEGAQVIFYTEFYDKNEKWLFEASVVSENMLIGILRNLFPYLSFTRTYFGHTSTSTLNVLESEILRVWGDDVRLTYDQLTERLLYIPHYRIKYALGQNGDFIWNSVETFSHISRIQITNDEREEIRAAAIRECNAHGYVSITYLPLYEIIEKNCGLSVTAVHNAVYRICLLDKFDKKGKIITRKGDVFDALTIMKEHCRTIDRCSLSDLLALEKELTGEIHRWIPMEAGNTILVRIDKDTYIADRYVHFSTDVIDDAIEMVVKNDYLPLKAFTTFSAFPECGQTWNLFLLESYCRRFSRKFRFDAPSVNSRNAGVIIRKSCGMNYTEIMTDAVAFSDVPLTASIVGRFLYDNGYTGRSTSAKVAEIIDKAMTMRERRN